MPKDGWASVTITMEAYSALAHHYDACRDAYRRRGVMSVSALLNMVVADFVDGRDVDAYLDAKEAEP